MLDSKRMNTFNSHLKNKFNENANAYEQYRPQYVKALYDDIFRAKAIDQNSNVLEIGIGTGQASVPILATDCNLVAIEIGDQLAKYAQDKFSAHKNFLVVNTSFEDYIENDNSFDLIYSASAFHWIEEAVGYKKVFRLLKPNGIFARFAIHPYPAKDDTELFDAIQACYQKNVPNSKPSPEYTAEKAKVRSEVGLKYGFVENAYYLYERVRTYNADAYVNTLETMHDHIALDANIRESLFKDIRETITRFGNHIRVFDAIDMQIARKPDSTGYTNPVPATKHK